MEFYDRYEALCIEKGLKPQEKKMRELFNVGSSTIGAWKTGTLPRIELLCKIADYFDVSVDYLLGRTDTRSMAAMNSDCTDVSTQVVDNVAGNTSNDVSSRGQILPANERDVMFINMDIENYSPKLHNLEHLVRLFTYRDFLMCYDPEAGKIIRVAPDYFDSSKYPKIMQKSASDLKGGRSGIISMSITEDEHLLIDVYRKVTAEGRARINQAVMNIYDEHSAAQPKEKANASAS